MADPLLVNFYRKLPRPADTDDPELWQAGVQTAMREFRDAVRNNYSEATLQRLLTHNNPTARQAAVLALGLMGTMASNAAVTDRLKDDDPLVRRFAHDAAWEIWLRGSDDDHCWSLRQVLQMGDGPQVLEALNELCHDAPEFAEAYNQRAIVRFRRGEFGLSATDCKEVLRLNPHHFGAAAGMGQCYLKLKKPRAALRAFQQALAINPALDHLRDAVKALQDALGKDREE